MKNCIWQKTKELSAQTNKNTDVDDDECLHTKIKLDLSFYKFGTWQDVVLLSFDKSRTKLTPICLEAITMHSLETLWAASFNLFTIKQKMTCWTSFYLSFSLSFVRYLRNLKYKYERNAMP